MKFNLKTVEQQVNEFDKMKFIDEDGKEKISGRELAKALGYSDWRNFKAAIKRTNDQIVASGKDNKELLVEVTKELKVKNQYGGESTRVITDYDLTRKQAINVANNCDTSKTEVAMVQEWLYDTSNVGEKAINIYNKMKDRQYIEDRSMLSVANKNFSATCINHNVDTKDLGKVHNACDESLYHMNTKEIKDKYGKTNRPKADFLGSVMCSAEAYAKTLSSLSIDANNADGVDECIDISSNIHEEVRDQIIAKSGQSPENLITGEDIKLVEKRYNNLTKEQLKAIEKEY